MNMCGSTERVARVYSIDIVYMKHATQKPLYRQHRLISRHWLGLTEILFLLNLAISRALLVPVFEGSVHAAGSFVRLFM